MDCFEGRFVRSNIWPQGGARERVAKKSEIRLARGKTSALRLELGGTRFVASAFSIGNSATTKRGPPKVKKRTQLARTGAT
jgi:hypothetical protein